MPRALLFVSGGVVVVAVAMAVIGALETGISWDEPYHVMRLQNYLDHGWFALDWAFADGNPAGGDDNTLVYGPITMLLLHALGVLSGTESWGQLSTTPAAYDVRHLGIVVIGLVGTAAAAGITRILMGSWRWALVTAAMLLALPMWTGHLMFNIKDVPVATGYTLTTLGMVAMVAPVRGRRVARIACLVAGVVLMVGTRPAMWTGLAAGLVVLGVGAVVAGRFGGGRVSVAEAAGGFALGVGILLAIYPNLFSHPMQLLSSAEQSASFRDGRDASYGYLPFYVLVQTPLLLLVMSAIGFGTAFAFVLGRWRAQTTQATRLALVGAQLLALPVASVARHSDLYNGLRQVLFAAPAWAILATIGLAKLLTWTAGRRTRWLGAALACVALIAPVIEQVTQFPYQYTYFNTGLDLTGKHVPSDYWRTSIPELLDDLPTDGQIVCGPTRSGEPKVAGRYSSDSSVDCRTDALGPLSSEWRERDLPVSNALPDDTFYVIIDRDHPLPSNCERLDGVTRDRHGRQITMTYAARCALAPRMLTDTPVVFMRPLTEPNMVADLWDYAPEGWVMRSSPTAIDTVGASASLTFQAADCTAGCDLVLDADAPDDLVATVAGTSLPVQHLGDDVSIRLAPGTSSAWVTFTRATDQPLDLRVRSLRLTVAE